jgi:hypothetical protein
MRITFRIGLLVFFVALSPLLACGSGSSANVSPSAMPDSGTFSGVYFSPQYGEMHLVQSGSAVRGSFKKDERSGKIQGEAEGNLLRFEWTEYKAMVSNRPQQTVGHGYFQYMVDAQSGDHVLKGKWGLGDEEDTGGEWNAYKSKSREADPDSLLGDESSGGESLDDDDGSGGDSYDDSGDSSDEGDDELGEDFL